MEKLYALIYFEIISGCAYCFLETSLIFILVSRDECKSLG